MVEHNLAKVGVASSSLVFRSKDEKTVSKGMVFLAFIPSVISDSLRDPHERPHSPLTPFPMRGQGGNTSREIAHGTWARVSFSAPPPAPPPSAGEPEQSSQPFVFQYITTSLPVHLRKLRCGQCAPDILLRPLSPQPPFAGEPEQSLQPSVFQYVPVNRAVHLRKPCGCECARERTLAVVRPPPASAGEPGTFA